MRKTGEKKWACIWFLLGWLGIGWYMENIRRRTLDVAIGHMLIL